MVSGSLMQLIAFGSQDAYICGNPDVTFFKKDKYADIYLPPKKDKLEDIYIAPPPIFTTSYNSNTNSNSHNNYNYNYNYNNNNSVNSSDRTFNDVYIAPTPIYNQQ